MTATRKRRRTAPAKDTTPKSHPAHLTVVDLRHPLHVRRLPAGPYTPQQLAEARAAQAAAYARLPIPVINWQPLPDDRTGAYMADDTLIVHIAERAPLFTAFVHCPHGALHQHQVTDQQTLHSARAATKACTSAHGSDDQDHAITAGVQDPPPPAAVRAPQAITPVRVLADALTKSPTSHNDTQQTNVTALRNAAANNDQEHPDHA